MPEPVLIPLLNPNEPEALLVALHVREGQRVAAGDRLCTLETTKSAAEIAAEQDGYIVGLRFQVGDTVRAGDLLCTIAGSPDWTPPPASVGAGLVPAHEHTGPASAPVGDSLVSAPMAATTRSDTDLLPIPTGLRITQPALALARQLGLDLNRLPADQLVTESVVRALHEQSPNASPPEGSQAALAAAPQAGAASPFDPAAILVYGGGGHGKALIDLLRLLGVYNICGVLDDGIPAGEKILGIPVLGGSAALAQVYADGVRLAVNAVGGIGNLAPRLKVFRQLAEAGFACPAVIHPRGFVESSATLSPGVQVFANAYVGSDARVGFGCIVNTGAVVSHDCILERYTNISPGAILAGKVHIGQGALIGMGATVNLLVNIGAGARVGNGATVKEDVPEKGIVRAGTIWPPGS